ncbi:MAG: topoisomerase IV, partial [Paraglaciecola sp.]
MKKLLTIAALTATTFAANAEVRINGFANLIGGISNTEGSPYGYGEDLSFSEESLFAIQISGDINEKM